jgi:hypothetical protein
MPIQDVDLETTVGLTLVGLDLLALSDESPTGLKLLVATDFATEIPVTVRQASDKENITQAARRGATANLRFSGVRITVRRIPFTFGACVVGLI